MNLGNLLAAFRPKKSRAAVPAKSDRPQQGAVTDISRDNFAGIAYADDGAPRRVSLMLNGRRIAGTWSVPGKVPNEHSFRINCGGVWKYKRGKDKLHIEIDGKELPLQAGVTVPAGDVKCETPAELFKKLDSGMVFNQKGWLQLSKTVDTKWQAEIFAQYDRLRADLKGMGVELVVCYGTMLGAVRGGAFIGHDHDFDAAIISKHSNPKDVREEFVAIGLELCKLGYRVDPKSPCLWISDPVTGAVVDCFHLYFDQAGKLQFPFGVAGERAFTKADFEGYVDLTLSGHQVSAIGNVERLVEYIYGEHWRTPNPGFNWKLDRREAATKARLHKVERDKIYWTDYYLNNRPLPPSSFSTFAAHSSHAGRTFIDIGCGDGRDIEGFAKAGKRVVGIDNCALAVEQSRQRIDTLKPGHGASIELGDCVRNSVLPAVGDRERAQFPDNTVSYYARFMLHSIDLKEEEALFAAISRTARSGEALFLEFRTWGDSKLKKKFKYQDRRFIDPAEFTKRLQANYGFKVAIKQHGNGFSVLGSENPELCRIVAVKN